MRSIIISAVILGLCATLIIADFGRRLADCRYVSNSYFAQIANIERDFFLFPKEP